MLYRMGRLVPWGGGRSGRIELETGGWKGTGKCEHLESARSFSLMESWGCLCLLPAALTEYHKLGSLPKKVYLAHGPGGWKV